MQFDLENIVDFKTFIKKSKIDIAKEKSFIHSKIDFWLEKLLMSLNSLHEITQKKKELIDLGKFIWCYNQNIEITDALCESPDFLISLSNRSIGIELTDLVLVEEEKEKEGLLKKLFKQVELELKNESHDYNGIYRIEFLKNISFNQINQNRIKSELLNLIRRQINSGTLIRYRKTFHTEISIYHSEVSVVGSLRKIQVEKCIEKKNKKISEFSFERYKELWLLLVIGGVQTSEDYSYIEDEVISLEFKTTFDKIFLFDFFTSEIIELKTSK
jgi:hypothetical protein